MTLHAISTLHVCNLSCINNSSFVGACYIWSLPVAIIDTVFRGGILIVKLGFVTYGITNITFYYLENLQNNYTF